MSKIGTQTARLRIVPPSRAFEVSGGLGTKPKVHSTRFVEAPLNLLSAQILGRWLCQPAVKFPSVPLRHRHGIRFSRNAVPNIFDEPQAVLNREPEDLLNECFRRHISISGLARPPASLRVTPN